MGAHWVLAAVGLALLCQVAYAEVDAEVDDFDFEYEDDISTMGEVKRGDYSKECGMLEGTKRRIKVNYGKASRWASRDMKRHGENFYNQAKKYGDKAKIILIGDSIINHVGKDNTCVKDIMKPYDRKGFVWGISGMMSDYALALSDWLFANHKLAPQVVYLAVGVNDCIHIDEGDIDKRDWKDVADNIIKTVMAIKYHSPSTMVVVQKILPTSAPYYSPGDFTGDEFRKFPLYKCITNVNDRVDKWLKRYGNDHCVNGADLSGVVLNDGRFEKNVLADGLHFEGDDDDEGKGNQRKYCNAIAGVVKNYDDHDVEKRSVQNGDWMDAQHPFTFNWESDTVYNHWTYNTWSNCTGQCGVQRRTPECHRVDTTVTNATLASYTVKEEKCDADFMHPLERVCNIDDTCLPTDYVSFAEKQQEPIAEADVEGCSKKMVIGFWVLVGLLVVALTGLAVAMRFLCVASKAKSDGNSALPVKSVVVDDDEDDKIPASI